jgi:transcription-repair coupling factor (superfamily II helicase)
VTVSIHNNYSVFTPPADLSANSRWGRLYGSASGMLFNQLLAAQEQLLLIVTPDTATANHALEELSFYRTGSNYPLLNFPEWETLPYDRFSPHQDIVAERLETLYRLPQLTRGVLVIPVSTLMHRIPPHSFINSSSLMLSVGEQLDLEKTRTELEQHGYNFVHQVMEYGEFTVRGSIIDLYPAGSKLPYRIELFDNEIESIRTFDPETQRSINKVEHIDIRPAREFPLNKEGITLFRKQFRDHFEGDPQSFPLYRDISNGLAPAGIEYYLPLFFDGVETLFDYLPEKTTLFTLGGVDHAINDFQQEVHDRYEIARFQKERPPLKPHQLFLPAEELFGHFKTMARHQVDRFEIPDTVRGDNFLSHTPPSLTFDGRAERPASKLQAYLDSYQGRVLFVAESTGRREIMLETLRHAEIYPQICDNWQQFIADDLPLAITVAPLVEGAVFEQPAISVIAEPQLYGQQVMQRRRRGRKSRDSDAVIRNLAELQIGNPVVHEDHGVGRYLGLQILAIGEGKTEFLTLEYADGDKLFVPVSSLDHISRYTGTSPEKAPLHKLGSGQWEKAKRKAKERVRDVAVELLEIYARREAKQGYAYPLDEDQYARFAADFPFEETPDQEDAIKDVITDMESRRPMDRLICGDVGFGKTEVAMRAAFVAVMAGKQVAVLVPTTLLSEQHLQNFRDRFADWPVQVESLSRFRSAKEQTQVMTGLEKGKVDIVIGTHKLIQEGIKYKNLGLVIIDEEHRFGVRQKDKFKSLRAEVDLLTLTATPIPRTLNMALGGMREMSIIASPPARRLAIKTFVHEWSNELIKEACMRELKRGGQVFFLHNEVESIDRQARELQELMPDTSIAVAHGQLRERELEQIMSDFYHQRFNILVCTTIIETGIDIPTANTIIMNRADRLGLAQLYQLRGRVGRSHHRAYAYLMIPSKKSITEDARKRLEAIESIEELGTGFTLASHDLEIRGAGELLGEEQSGQMQEIGFTLYAEMLDRAVKALKEGKSDLDAPAASATEIDIGLPALIPEDFIPDVHNRLILYKRIASATSNDELRELQVEIIDRFGLIPEASKTLFELMKLKLRAAPLGISRMEFGPQFGRISFIEQPNLDPMKIIALIQKQPAGYKLDSKQRLKVIKAMPDTEMRLTTARELLNYLS